MLKLSFSLYFFCPRDRQRHSGDILTTYTGMEAIYPYLTPRLRYIQNRTCMENVRSTEEEKQIPKTLRANNKITMNKNRISQPS